MITQPGWENALRRALQQDKEETGFTDAYIARLGNGDDPGLYVVEVVDREYSGQPCMWVHRETENGIERSQAINAGNCGIPFNNNNQPLMVRVSKPPGETRFYLERLLEASLSAYNGSPLEAQIQQAALNTPDKEVYNIIFHVEDMMVGLRAGLWRLGNYHLHNTAENTAFVDLADYLPAASGNDKWVLIGQNWNGDAVVTEGFEFATADTNPLDFVPTEVEAGVYYFGRARLTYGDTNLAGKLVVFPDSAYIANGPFLQSSDPGAVGAGATWIDTSGGTGAFGLSIRDESNSDWEPIVSAGGSTSGTYTPTLTNVANLDASTAYTCQYFRVGNVVTVSGKVSVDPTTTSTSTKLGLSLPIASNIGAEEDCAGVAFCPTIHIEGAAILGDATNNRAQLEWITIDTSNRAMFFTFSYSVL